MQSNFSAKLLSSANFLKSDMRMLWITPNNINANESFYRIMNTTFAPR